RVIAATGSTSEDAAQRIYNLPETALLDMGDFAGGLLKYLREHPLPAITLAGGFAKFTKLAQGALDLHSGRSQVDFMWLAGRVDRLIADMPSLAMKKIVGDQILAANTAAEVLTIAQSMEIDLPREVAKQALETAKGVLRGAPVDVEILIVDRQGEVLARES
ncbi:MAG: cobalt-precorrin-5B (C(1))-methyltransferase, partial [Pseudomonadota bacterium]